MLTKIADSSEHDIEDLTALFKVLSDPTRLLILARLAKGEMNVSALCDELNLPQPTVSHHLALLRVQRVIDNRRNGKQVFYALNGRIDQGSAEKFRITTPKFAVEITYAAPRH